MYKIYSIIINSRVKKKRRVNFISIRKVKFYTKETLKLFNIALLAFGFIIAIILIKYKPMYEVKVSGERVGYVENKQQLDDLIEKDVENYTAKNIEKVDLVENPEYELKFVEKTKESNESEIIVALQKELDITYKYYEIYSNEQTIEKVDTMQIAEQIINDINILSEKQQNLNINEKTTKNIEELGTNTLEVAENNIIQKLDIDTSKAITHINGIKISSLPVSGVISSRYGVSSSIRSSRHTGLDIATKKGTPIKVIANGNVIFARRNGAYGNLVKVDHGNGVETWYAHASEIYVKEGQKVKAGDIIASVGSTGNSTGPHLHLEVRINGKHVNPQKYLYNN